MGRKLDATKAAFVVRSGARTDEQLQYLAALRVPDGMTAEVVTVEGADAELAALYREVQEKSDAKYKIYLAPDAVILRATFLRDALRIFRKAPEAGILGLRGARQLLTDGRFENALGICGRTLLRTGASLAGDAIKGAFADVSVLAGGVLVTQYDVPWPETAFEGTSYLAMAMSVACRRAGYRVVVPQQADDWLLRDAPPSPTAADERDCQMFLDTCSEALYPLVSVVIPTYQRPAYFREALTSVVQQTYRNLDIFITDNSHDEETKHVYETEFADDPRITYEHHPEFDAAGNWAHAVAYDHPQADYVNWLMDDDTFYPEKIARMMNFFLKEKGITLVTSVRQFVDKDGHPIKNEPGAEPLTDQLCRLNGRELGRSMLRRILNFIGEPTTVLIKKSAMHERRLGWTGKAGKYFISDFPTWLCALSKGDCIYFPEPLSTFRVHKDQQQRDPRIVLSCLICWAMAIREAIRQHVFLTTPIDRRMAILRWLGWAADWLRNLPADTKETQELRDLYTVMKGMANALPEAQRVEFSIDTGVRDA